MKVELLLFSLFIMILTALLASMRPYTNEEFQDSVSDVSSDRIIFLKVGLINFFAQEKNVEKLGLAALVQFAADKILFWPNYIDLCCKSTVVIDDNGAKKAADCDCNNISLLTSSCVDETLTFMNEKRVRTIQGSLGAPTHTNCTLTILGCNYRIMKRSIKMSVKESKHIGAHSTPRFEITMTGNVAPFILSRPIFVSFNMGGLYQVTYEDFRVIQTPSPDPLKRNALAYFDSTSSEHRIIIKKITSDDVFGREMYVDTPNTISGMSGDTAMTIFYVNFDNEVHQSSMTASVASFMLSDETLAQVFQGRSQITFVTGATDSMFCNNIALRQRADGMLVVTIDDIDYELPQGFVYNGSTTPMSKYHIVASYSYDILTIACFGVLTGTRKNVCYMVRYHTPKIFKMNKDDLLSAVKENGLWVNNMSDVFCATAVPNFALLAYKLGYVFDIY